MPKSHSNLDGTTLLTRDDGETLLVPAGADVAQASADFFGPDLSMPDQIPMHKLRMWLVVEERKQQVINFLNSLPEPNKSLAMEEWNTAPFFLPNAALGRAAQAAMGLSDAEYAAAVRMANQYTVEDYGSPTPGLLAAIMRFLFTPT